MSGDPRDNRKFDDGMAFHGSDMPEDVKKQIADFRTLLEQQIADGANTPGPVEPEQKIGDTPESRFTLEKHEIERFVAEHERSLWWGPLPYGRDLCSRQVIEWPEYKPDYDPLPSMGSHYWPPVEPPEPAPPEGFTYTHKLQPICFQLEDQTEIPPPPPRTVAGDLEDLSAKMRALADAVYKQLDPFMRVLADILSKIRITKHDQD